MTPEPDWHKPQPEQLPQPTYAPLIMALGLMFLLWGAVTHWIVSAAGLAVIAVASALWISDLHYGPKPDVSKRRLETQLVQPALVSAAAPKHNVAFVTTRALHRYAILLAAVSLMVVITGAVVTSSGPSAPSALIGGAHLAAAGLVALLTLGLVISFYRIDAPQRIRRMGLGMIAALLAQAALGGQAPAVSVLHAFLAQIFFAATVAVAVITSNTWQQIPETLEDSGFSLRILAIMDVALIVIQVALGAAVRHNVIGPMIHIFAALIVALFLMLLGIMLINKWPEHPVLRPAAMAMMAITGVQVFLGFTTFIIKLVGEENSLPMMVSSVAHVTTGALTLASTTVVALQVHRNVHRADAQRRESPTVAT